jgi:hypothetical protein
MAEVPAPPQFEFDLADFGGVIRLASPQELQQWVQDEETWWKWMGETGSEWMNSVWNEHRQFYSNVRQIGEQWNANRANPHNVHEVLKKLDGAFQTYYCQKRIFHSSNPDVAFISKLKEDGGNVLAGGAYCKLLKRGVAGVPAQGFDGLFEAFLYEREIEWSASAHRETLNKLRQEYSKNLDGQKRRFKEIESQNLNLNEAFGQELKKRTEALDKFQEERGNVLTKLHEDQSTEFSGVIKKHEDALKAIEQTYDAKLALKKPVEYWQTKEGHHRGRSIWWGIAALVTMACLTGLLGGAVLTVLGGLEPNQDPEHWQIGMLLVALFFSIWLVRVLVRIFLSHLHLATDAAERRMMVLTYLSIGREGTPFSPEEKRIILEHLFRSASDGLVKDDAAPPTPLEMLSRSRS